MISEVTGALPGDRAAAMPDALSDRDLMARALAIYQPDLGLAIHRALEAREVARETLGAPILDLGCGDGRFACLWMGGPARPPKSLGCDAWLPALRRAVDGCRLSLVVAADGRQLPLAESCMGTVIANSVLTHVPDLSPLLGEVARILRPGGQFLAAIPGPAFENQLAWVRFFRRLGFPWIAQRIGDGYHLRWQQWHRDGEAVWSRRLAAHGLALVEARPYPGDFTGLVWSLAFSLGRFGLGRFSLLNALKRLWPRKPLEGMSRRPRVSFLARMLAPLLAKPGTPGGSLFLIARREVTCPLHSPVACAKAPRVHPEIKQPDREAALRWLVRSRVRISENEAAVMAGGYANLVEGWTGQAPMLYCEITGYAAQFWLRQEDGDALDRATAAGECLLRAQVSADGGRLAGGFPYGLSRPEGNVVPAYFSFDAAICASALVDLATRAGASRFADGARRAGQFLARMQRPDGSFTAMHSTQSDHPELPRPEGWFGDGCALHGKNAIALLKLWHLTGETHWRDAARRTLDWVCRLQWARGAFPQWAGAPYSMTHTHCYATEGLLYGGLILGEERYLMAGVRGAEWLRFAQRWDAGLHRDYRMDGEGIPKAAPGSSLHVGPIAQAARIWWVAAQIAPGRPWAEAATRALGFLARVQAPNTDPWGCGAFPQSARPIGPWLRKYPVYSPWEAMFACEAARLWTTGVGDPLWSIF